jgi:hypothetical protein
MIYDKNHVKQLKLVTGDEIICEILEEDEIDIIVRNVLSIQHHITEVGTRMWAFNYFMCSQDDPDKFTLIRSDKVVGVAVPPESLMLQYQNAIREMIGEEEFSEDDDYMQEMLNQDSDRDNIVKFPGPVVH